MAGSPKDPVNKTFVNVSLTGGVNKKRDSHLLQNGELLTAENVIYSAVDGQITKRFGFASVTPSGAPFQGGPFKALGCRDNSEPIVLGANTLNRYNVAQNISTALGTPTQGRLWLQSVAASSGKQLTPTPPMHAHSASDGVRYLCVAWEEPSATAAQTSATQASGIGSPPNVWYGIQDLATNSWIQSPVLLPTGRSSFTSGVTYIFNGQYAPQVNFYRGNFYISTIWTGGTTAKTSWNAYIQVQTIPAATPTATPTVNPYFKVFTGNSSSNTAVTTNPYGTTAGVYDMHIANGLYILALVSPFVANTAEVSAGLVSDTGTLSVQTSKTLVVTDTGAAPVRIACKCDGPAAVPFGFCSNEYAFVMSNTYVVTQSPTADVSIRNFPFDPVDCMMYGNGLATLTYAVDFSTSANYTGIQLSLYQNISGALSAYTQALILPPMPGRYIELLSRLFVAPNGKLCAWVAVGSNNNSDTYNSAMLFEFDVTTRQYAWITRTLYLGMQPLHDGAKLTPSEIVRVPGTSRYTAFLSSSIEKVTPQLSWGVLNKVTFDFAPGRQVQILPLPTGGNVIAGAFPLVYDGASVFEMGFSAAPDYTQTQTSQGTAGPAVGFTVASAASGLAGGSSLITNSGKVEYYYVVCLVRRDSYGNVSRSAPSPVITVPCPNAANTVTFAPITYNGGGSIQIEFYRSTQGTPGTYYFLQTVSPYAVFTDKTADGSTAPGTNTSITKNRTVYTNSNELPNDPPPACHYMAMSENRAFMIPSDNRNVIWYSKQFSPGRSVEFCANLTLSEGLNSGQFTGLAILDSNCIVFKQDQVLYFYGNGPDNTGANGGFSPFQKIASDVGCIDPGSICVIPDGVVFRSRRGIELLTRGLQIVYIGSNVEPLVQSIGSIASVVVMPGYTELRFVPATAGQPVLCYDYGAKRWSTFTNMAAVQATSIQGNYWFISTDGTLVNQETPGVYSDNGTPIIMKLETPEIPVGAAGVQGWGRLYRMALLGDFGSAHTLGVSFAYDHSTTYTDAVNFSTAAGLINGDAVYQFRCSRTPRSRMQTVRLKFQDTGTTGQSCGISNLVLEVGAKNGLAHLPPAKTI